MLCSNDITEAADQENPLEKETTNENDKFSAIHLLHTSYLVRYGNLDKELQNGSQVGRDKYPTTSEGAYELMVCRSGIYQSIGNCGKGGERENSNSCGNQHNQR